jgi:NAD(P)-dependent dehydrogenase (short-subunit alcohol dehydrogenase family)
MQLSNKTAIITGGASGIGNAIVRKFYEAGANVHVLDVNEIEEGERIHFHHCDVSNHQEVHEKIKRIVIEPIDILVNNAGIGFVGDLLGTSEEDMDRLFSINVKGVYNCMHAIMPSMLENGGGVILNMASTAASVGISDRFAYSMTKGAVRTMTFCVAKDYVDKNIRCNCISPARIHTPFVDGYLAKNYPGKEEEVFKELEKTQPVGRMGKPEEVADLAVFLCSDQAGFITGTDYPIDGGFIRLNT